DGLGREVHGNGAAHGGDGVVKAGGLDDDVAAPCGDDDSETLQPGGIKLQRVGLVKGDVDDVAGNPDDVAAHVARAVHVGRKLGGQDGDDLTGGRARRDGDVGQLVAHEIHARLGGGLGEADAAVVLGGLHR